jgi:hypothetical protein
MGNPANDWTRTNAVSIVDRMYDISSVRYALTDSKSLATIFNVAIPANACGVIVMHGGTVHYNPAGGASASNAAISTGYVISGSPDFLANVRLYAASETNIDVVMFGTRAGDIALVTT